MYKTFVDTSVILRYFLKDDEAKTQACEVLFREAKHQGIALYILPVAILETVWVLERVYQHDKKTIRDVVEAILNTPEFRVEMADVFLKAVKTYEEKNIKFAGAVMGYWGLERGFSIVYSYDEKDFKRIVELEIRKP